MASCRVCCRRRALSASECWHVVLRCGKGVTVRISTSLRRCWSIAAALRIATGFAPSAPGLKVTGSGCRGVNQHAAICDQAHGEKDSLTGHAHPLCASDLM